MLCTLELPNNKLVYDFSQLWQILFQIEFECHYWASVICENKFKYYIFAAC